MRPRNGAGAPDHPTDTSSGPIRAARRAAGALLS